MFEDARFSCLKSLKEMSEASKQLVSLESMYAELAPFLQSMIEVQDSRSNNSSAIPQVVEEE
jgi:t-SNARE complex subunit (syntaxin)